ncbi:MAG: flagellar biosynthetic protein FliR [Polyangiaceae bacterium]
MTPLVSELVDVFRDAGVDLGAVGLVGARLVPTIFLVPAFGLRALPGPVRAVFGLAFAAALAPATQGVGTSPGIDDARVPWAVSLGLEFLRGLPLAVATAVPLWAATMAGGLVDDLRGVRESASSSVVDGKPSLVGVPFALLAGALFFATGGPTRVLAAHLHPPAFATAASWAPGVVRALTDGIALSVAIAAPVVTAAIVVEVASALVARAASPGQVHALLAPVKALFFFAVLALVFERVADVIVAAEAAAQSGMR